MILVPVWIWEQNMVENVMLLCNAVIYIILCVFNKPSIGPTKVGTTLKQTMWNLEKEMILRDGIWNGGMGGLKDARKKWFSTDD